MTLSSPEITIRTGLDPRGSSPVQVLPRIPRGTHPERTALVNQTFPTLYEVIEPMLRFCRFGLCGYKTIGATVGPGEGGQQLCQAAARVCDLTSRQEMCLVHFELARAS
jgi:hypothetical protein